MDHIVKLQNLLHSQNQIIYVRLGCRKSIFLILHKIKDLSLKITNYFLGSWRKLQRQNIQFVELQLQQVQINLFSSLQRYNHKMKQDLQCIYKSFEGCGSFYVALFPVQKISDHLKRYGIRAILNLSPTRNLQPQYPGQFQVLRLPIQESEVLSLKKPFERSFQFFDKKRTKTNILICGHKKNICLVFLYAFLMKKYKYHLAHITKLLGSSSKNIILEPQMLEQLNKLSMQLENDTEEEDPELLDSKIGRRIKRIRQEYTKLAKHSRSSSRSIHGQKQYKYQVYESPKKIDFTPDMTQIDSPTKQNQAHLVLRTSSRYVKKLSNFY